MKATRREEISIEQYGTTYRGSRVVEGTRKLFQTIYYGGESRFDGHAYRPGEEAYMRAIAETILGELVQESRIA
jgi:hypothetical protein